ncbi:MAG: 2-keto-4-pentenoate hydratase [Reyranella sp.]|uniref:2-keto-4-pentenoate hydratase n=1 Tax=Reyranella sp. TaxID=1929291 RepID=UPI003D11E445
MKSAVERAADRLVAARRNRQPTPGLPEVKTFDDAYAVQEAFCAKWDDIVVGHKVGCSSEQSQRLVNSPGPIAGSLFRTLLWLQPALDPAQFFVAGVEAEFGFRLGADLPPRAAPYDRDEVSAAVDAVVPVIEICDTRLDDWRTRRIEEITADNAFNGGLVAGRPLQDWRRLDLASHAVTLSIDGDRKGAGTGALVLGHPLLALTWLANELSRRGSRLRAGELIAAGTCTGLHFVTPGSSVVADFGDLLGQVTIRFGR